MSRFYFPSLAMKRRTLWWRCGAEINGASLRQVTLNPLPHIRREPFGTVLVPLISFFLAGYMIGWGSAPYDPRWEQQHPRRAALMACAGPAANFLLAFVAIIAMKILIGSGLASGGVGSFSGSPGAGAMDALLFFLNLVFLLNLLLGCFNLIPVAPLDGHTAIGIFLPEQLFLRWLNSSALPCSPYSGCYWHGA